MGTKELDVQNDRAIAQALADRPVTREEAFDERLAEKLQEDEIAEHAQSLGALPALPADERQLRLERRVSESLAEAIGIPHRPRTNSLLSGGEEWRFDDEDDVISEDRARLMRRLETYSLCERQVKGDGNCQFRALSDQLYGTPVHHSQVRHAAVQQLRAHPDAYAPFVESDWGAYLRDMARQGTWGDHLTLQAVADYFGVEICVISSYEAGEVIKIVPRGLLLTSKRVLYLSFWAEVHYNSVFPKGEPPGDLPHDKTLGSRRLYHLIHRNGPEVY